MRLREIEQEAARLAEPVRAFMERISRNRKHTYLLPQADRLWVVETRGGKLLSRQSVPLADRNKREDLVEALRSVKAGGWRGPFTLLANFPGLRVGRKKFPDMTADELEETLYWEQDRIFYNGDSLALSYHVLRHTPEGYVVFLHGMPKDILDLWWSAAEEAGLDLPEAIPVTDISPGGVPCFVLYERRYSAILVYWGGSWVQTRVVKLAEEGQTALFLQRAVGQKEMPDIPFYLVPLADVEEEKRQEWHAYAVKELDDFHAGHWAEEMDGEPAEEEEPVGLYPDEEMGDDTPLPSHPGHTKVLLQEPVEDPESPGWNDILPLFLRAETAEARFTAHPEAPFERDERRPLRIVQGVAIVAGLFFLFSGGQYVVETVALHRAQERAEALTLERERYEQHQAEEKRAQDMLAELKELDKKNPMWEQKLVLMADTMPDGVVLKSIQSDRGASKVTIEGTAQENEGVNTFRKRLQWSWGGRALIRKQARNTLTHLVEFKLEWESES